MRRAVSMCLIWRCYIQFEQGDWEGGGGGGEYESEMGKQDEALHCRNLPPSGEDPEQCLLASDNIQC